MKTKLFSTVVAVLVIGSCISAQAAEPNATYEMLFDNSTAVVAAKPTAINNSDNPFAGKIVRVTMTGATRNEVFMLENVKLTTLLGNEFFFVGTGIKNGPRQTSWCEGLVVNLNLHLVASYCAMTPEQWKVQQRSTPTQPTGATALEGMTPLVPLTPPAAAPGTTPLEGMTPLVPLTQPAGLIPLSPQPSVPIPALPQPSVPLPVLPSQPAISNPVLPPQPAAAQPIVPIQPEAGPPLVLPTPQAVPNPVSPTPQTVPNPGLPIQPTNPTTPPAAGIAPTPLYEDLTSAAGIAPTSAVSPSGNRAVQGIALPGAIVANVAAAELKALQDERIKLLTQTVEVLTGQYNVGAADIAQVATAESELCNALLDSTDEPEKRIALLTKQLDRANGFVKVTQIRYQSGTVSNADVYRAKSQCLDVKIKLLRERSKK